MENGECREPSGIIKNALHILVVTSVKQQLLGRIFSMHSPSIRMVLKPELLKPYSDRILTYGTLLDVLWQMYHPWITYGTVRRIV